MTPFQHDPVHEGVARFQQDIFIPEYYLEPTNRSCSSLTGATCSSLHGPSKEVASPGGLFALFGSLPGDPGFFIQDEVGPYFANAAGAEEGEPPKALAKPGVPAKCVRINFWSVPPTIRYLPTIVHITSSLYMQVVGTVAVVTTPDQFLQKPGDNGTKWKPRQRVHLEFQDPIVYLHFSQPVVVEQIWVHREVPQQGLTADPTVIRGRYGVDELWSAYLSYGDFRKGWVTPLSFTPSPVGEVIFLGAQGLRVASIEVAVMPQSSSGATTAVAAVPAMASSSQPRAAASTGFEEGVEPGGSALEGLPSAPLEHIGEGAGCAAGPSEAATCSAETPTEGTGLPQDPPLGAKTAGAVHADGLFAAGSSQERMGGQQLYSRGAGYMVQPLTARILSLHDLGLSKIGLPSAGVLYSIAEVHRRGDLQIRSEMLPLGGMPFTGLEKSALKASAPDEDVPKLPQDEPILKRSSFDQGIRFGDYRTLGGVKALTDALLTGAFRFPSEVPLHHLEQDVEKYGQVYRGVTLEEAVNARSADELHERLFTANRMDALDLLMLRFLWANHTGTLRVPGRVVGESGGVFGVKRYKSATAAAAVSRRTLAGRPPSSEFNALQGASTSMLAPGDLGQRRRRLVHNLRRHVAYFAAWKGPVQAKVNFFNSIGTVDVMFALHSSPKLIGVDFYNGASGKGRKLDLQVPDAPYLMAELLGIHGQYQVDNRGRRLPKAKAAKFHAEKTFITQLTDRIRQLQLETLEFPEPALPEAGTARQASLEEQHVHPAETSGSEENGDWNTPPLGLVLAVSSTVAAAVILAVLAPVREHRQPRALPPWLDRMLRWSERLLSLVAPLPLEMRREIAAADNARPRRPAG